MKKLFLFIFLPVVLLFLDGIGHTARAGGGQPPILQVLDGSLGQLSKDSFNIVSDTLFFGSTDTATVARNYPVRNTIRLKINPYTPYFLKRNFSATLRLEVTVTAANGTMTSFDTSLTVRYNKDSLIRDEDSYLFNNGYRVKVKVIDRQTDADWDIWKSLTLENEMETFPVFNFTCTADTIQSVSHSLLDSSTTSDELTVSWTHVISADQYDLEWTYVDSSALKNPRQPYGDPASPDAALIFGNGATRVTITGTAYNIPIFYDGAGTLFFRVRPVQLLADGSRIEGQWSSDHQAPGNFYFKGHQRNLNWQSTASYAEEGKRKVVVQYYDGSLRGRQTVTKDNTTNTTVVAESFYDYQGRPVIQVLPAPTFSNVIQYSRNFNLGMNGVAYGKNDFDSLGDASQYCGSHAAAMDTSGGAAQYYSPANPERDTGIAKYIPDAGGYPFTEVEYVQDNTGRISRQSGVGPRHRLGSGHETSYYYGTPDQHELDALFGTEVGDNSHYFKTMVRDANGQFSVSYTDMHGRTIATALAGVADSAKLDTLSSYRSQSITESLTNPAANVVHDLVMESKKGLVVAVGGWNLFHYKLNPASLQMPDCNGASVCYDCLYDLEITMTDDCNNQKLGGQAFDTVIHNFSLGGRPDTTCARAADSFAFNFSKWLEPGSYEITKRLSVSRWGESYYRDSVFMKRNACKTANTFLLEQKAIQTSLTQCVPSCDSCKAQLGDWPTYYQRYIAHAGIAADDSSYKDMILTAYQQAQADCRLLCDSIDDPEDIKQAMLLDMTPPSGQYATVDSSSDPYSIFYVKTNSDGDPIDSAVYTIASNNYVDEYGRPDSVYDETAGRMVRPQELSQESFAQKFKLSWAQALLPYHPEYCKLNQYLYTLQSVAWDKRFESTDTYAEALSKGYLNPISDTDPLFTRFNATGVSDYDSFCVAGPYFSPLEDSISTYINKGGLTMTMWGVATAAIRCPGGDNACMMRYQKLTNDDSAFNSNMCMGDLDMAWRTFRQMYLDVKHKRINASINGDCGTSMRAKDILASGHQPHFTDAGELQQALGLTPPSDPASAVAGSQAAVDSYYDTTCKTYVTAWWQALKSCYTSKDSAIIIPRLIQVCKEGSDASHPYGASSVKPSSSYQYTSFEDVLEQYNADSGYSSTTCNAYGIKAPKPYDQQLAYSSKPLWTRPDSCECDHIQSVYNNYLAVSSHYLSFSDYMYKAYQTSIADSVLTQLRNLCTVDPSAGGCVYQSAPIQLPPALQCSTGDICVGCTQFKSLDAEFRGRYPGLTPVMTPSATDSTQLGINRLYEQFMNYRLGFTKPAAEYLAFLNGCNGVSTDPSGSTTHDTATISCAGLDSLVKEYKRIYLQPVLGYVDLDMRTFAGNITPADGPKGVFNLNGALIGNTADGTSNQVNASFASLWNSDTADQRIGVLTSLDNGKFHLQLNNGQLVPVNGITGMRYYQFDIPYDTLDAVLTNLGSYIDFGDGQHIRVDSSVTASPNKIGEVYLSNNRHHFSLFYVSHVYGSTQNRTVTVYHTDINGVVGFDNYLDGLHAQYLPALKNLRGYAPENVLIMQFHSTQDSSINTLDGFVNKDKLSGLLFFNTGSGDGGGINFRNYNFGSLIAFRDLRECWITGDTPFHPSIDSILPNMPVNFPNLQALSIAGSALTSLTNLSLPHIEYLIVTGVDSAALVDQVLNQVAAVAAVDSGVVGVSGAARSPASDPAVAHLNALKWTVATATETLNYPYWIYVPADTLELKKLYPAGSAFMDFINSKFGDSLSLSQVNDLFRRKCGALPDLVTPDTVEAIVPGDSSCSQVSFMRSYTALGGGEIPYDIVMTPDGGYLTAGKVKASKVTPTYYPFVAKTNSKGILQWYKTYGVGSDADQFAKVRVTQDGGFIALGNTLSFSAFHGTGGHRDTSVVFIVKADASGNVQWARSVDTYSLNGELGIDIIQTSDKGYAVAADYNNIPGSAAWEVVKLDSTGARTWSKVMSTFSTNQVGGLLEDRDTLVLSGYCKGEKLPTAGSDNFYDGIIMKISRDTGGVVWTRSFNIGNTCNWFNSIYNSSNGYLISAVNTDDFDPEHIGQVVHLGVELDRNGHYQRIRAIDSVNDDTVSTAALYPTSDGGYISVRHMKHDGGSYIHKTSAGGSISWTNRIGFADIPETYNVLPTGDGHYMVSGIRTGAQDMFVLRTDSLGRVGCSDSSMSFSSTPIQYTETNQTFAPFFLRSTSALQSVTATDRTATVNALCYHAGCPARIITDTMFLCGRAEPVLPPVLVNTVTNCSDSTFFAVSKSTELYNVYTDSTLNNFDSSYHAQCMQAYKYEQFTVTHVVSEYHHTLYYYDQAGNLIRTVPPAGVKENYDSTWLDNVAAARALDQSLVPAHGLHTQYRYNTLNQVISQQTPDGGQSRFWYDRLGRLSISQNARQQAVSGTEAGRQYSYTLYDDIGRITEVGQLSNAGSAPMTDSISRTAANLSGWLTASVANKEQITQTVYDIAYTGFTGLDFTPLVQRNLRNRVAYTTFTNGSNPAQYNQGTFYTYDIEGNVDTLLQDYGSSSIGTAQNIMNLNGNRFKRMVYRYDLVSGKVNSVAYQPHQVDAFYHRYTYDAENRLTLAETSTDSVYWDKEARYEYYKHGPLARIIIGDKMVQGLDYAYTLQGWLKGVNSTSLLPVYDMGRDGDTTYQNRYIAKDVYGFGLNYYSGDYAPIGTGVDPFPGVSGYLNTNDRPLFNGNISSMAVNLGPLYENPGGTTDTSHWRGPLLYSYRYDQLNRITGMDAYYGLNQATNSWAGLLPTADFRERVSYDGNGNILGYKRNNFGETGLPMDSLHYNYITGTNKLDFIRDSASDAVGGGYDLHTQPGSNYAYDSIGNLVKDSSEKISAIHWNVYGKITEIDRSVTTAARPTKNIYYYYDAAGHRIGKKVVRGDTSAVSYTWYVRDASGNVMATYTAGIDSTKADSSADLQLNEQHIYGSSRLGILTVNRSVDGNTTGANNYVSPWTGVHLPYYTGRKQYELSNHLGNVLATITDKKIGVSLASDSSLIDHYEADVKTAQDYYPFGMIMPGRMFTAISIPGGTYSGTTQVNGYTLPVDLTVSSRTGGTPSTYTATHGIDLTEGFESGTNDDVTVYIADTSYAGGGNGEDDGSAVAGTGKYRYGFNGKENDNEVKGIGDQIDYGMRVYDPRAGRFMSVDPYSRKYPNYTPYSFAGNKALWYIDLDGLEEALPWYLRKNKYGGKPVLTLGLGNLKTADRWEYGNQSWYSDQKIFTFLHNGVVAGWNSIANTWNEAMDGKTGTDIVSESIQNLQETKLSDFKKVETWENIAGGLLTLYVTKRIGEVYGARASAAQAAVVKNRISFAKEFYIKHGFEEGAALSHIEGINLAKKVFTTVLKKGTVIQQWVGERGVGNYFTSIENGAAKNLGLNDYGARTLKQFTLTSDVEVLQSTAGEYKSAAGGGVQYFSTKLKNSIEEVAKKP